MFRSPLNALAALLILSALGGLAGCGQSSEARYVGTWELDREVVKEAMRAEIAGVEDPDEREAMELGMAMIGEGLIEAMNMTLVLNKDGSAASTTTLMGQSETVYGRWSAKGNLLRIEMSGDGESEALDARVEGDTLELLPPEDDDMPFRLVMRRLPQ